MNLRNIIVFEPHSYDVFKVTGATIQELERLDDEENYVIIDPATNECFINGSWVDIPEGHFLSDNQLVVIGKKGEAANDPKS